MSIFPEIIASPFSLHIIFIREYKMTYFLMKIRVKKKEKLVSHPSSAEVKNVWSCASTPHISSRNDV